MPVAAGPAPPQGALPTWSNAGRRPQDANRIGNTRPKTASAPNPRPMQSMLKFPAPLRLDRVPVRCIRSFFPAKNDCSLRLTEFRGRTCMSQSKKTRLRAGLKSREPEKREDTTHVETDNLGLFDCAGAEPAPRCSSQGGNLQTLRQPAAERTLVVLRRGHVQLVQVGHRPGQCLRRHGQGQAQGRARRQRRRQRSGGEPGDQGGRRFPKSSVPSAAGAAAWRSPPTPSTTAMEFPPSSAGPTTTARRGRSTRARSFSGTRPTTSST